MKHWSTEEDSWREKPPIPDRDREVLKSTGLLLLHLNPDKWADIEEKRAGGSKFSLVFSHSETREYRPQRLALIITSPSEPLRLGIVHSKQAVSTLGTRISFGLVAPVCYGDWFEHVLVFLEQDRNSGKELMLLPRRLGEFIVDQIIDEQKNRSLLSKLFQWLIRPQAIHNARPLQEDAVGLAMKAFGATDAIGLEVYSDTTLRTVRLHEDAVVENDARSIKGWQLDRSDLTGRALFKKQDQILEVVTANKRPLEELFGVDLIYHHHGHKAITMVQYKIAEPSYKTSKSYCDPYRRFLGQRQEKEWIVRLDSQFLEELERMRRFDKDASDTTSYRLNSSPFYFKFMKRMSKPNAAGLVMSLGHVEHLLKSGQAEGPKKGLRINYQELGGHYLRSSQFIDLIGTGYIGSHDATSEHFDTLIQQTLASGRGLVAAIQKSFR